MERTKVESHIYQLASTVRLFLFFFVSVSPDIGRPQQKQNKKNAQKGRPPGPIQVECFTVADGSECRICEAVMMCAYIMVTYMVPPNSTLCFIVLEQYFLWNGCDGLGGLSTAESEGSVMADGSIIGSVRLDRGRCLSVCARMKDRCVGDRDGSHCLHCAAFI